MSRKAWLMLFWLLATQVAVALVGRSVGPLAPFIEQSFHLTKTQVGLLPAALFVGQSLVSLPAGWYADKLGTKKMLFLISVALTVCFLCIAVVPWFWAVLLLVCLGGMGYGAMQPTANRGIMCWFPPEFTGTAMGIKQMGVTSGSALAALVLVPLAVWTDWRWAAVFAALLLLGLGGLSYVFYRDPPGEQDELFNDKVSFLDIVPRLWRKKSLLMLSIAAMGLTGAQLSLTTYLVPYISGALLYPLVTAAVFLSLSELSGSAGRVIWGILSDRVFHGDRIRVMILIAVVAALCSIAAAWMPPRVSPWILTPLVALFGFSIAGYNGLWMNAVAELVPLEYTGVATGFSLAIGSLGVVFGPPCFGWLIDLTGGYSAAWLAVALDMLIVILLLLFSLWQIQR